MRVKRGHKIFLLFLASLTSIFFINCSDLKVRKKQNIILITLDALRPDHLSCYGYQRNTSPYIDKIAKDGALFLNAIAQGNATQLSLVSILTSTYPVESKVFRFGDRISDKVTSLANILNINGYQTAFFSSHPVIATINGFEDYFHKFYTIWTFSDTTDWQKKKATEITTRITNWIKENKNKRFFIWAHYLEPHEITDYPLPNDHPFRDNLYKEEINLPIVERDGLGGISRSLAVANNNISNLNYYVNLYDSKIQYVDNQVGELIGCLKKMDLYEKTTIIISADHGEALGEHNQFIAHGIHLYDELVRIPLIIKFSNYIPGVKKIVTQVQQIDIASTILDILGIKKPANMAGSSLIPLLNNDNDLVNYAFSFDCCERISVRTNKWKLIYTINSNLYELYNLREDPLELNNVISSRNDVYKLLRGEMDKYTKETAQNQNTKTEMDKAIIQQLKSLGYW